jgi:hypothetical protein
MSLKISLQMLLFTLTSVLFLAQAVPAFSGVYPAMPIAENGVAVDDIGIPKARVLSRIQSKGVPSWNIMDGISSSSVDDSSHPSSVKTQYDLTFPKIFLTNIA